MQRVVNKECTCMHIHLGWTMVPSSVIVEPCTSPVGPCVSISHNPLEMFSHFISDTLLSEIVEQTNLYATQCLAAANAQTTWQASIEELKAYIGFTSSWVSTISQKFETIGLPMTSWETAS